MGLKASVRKYLLWAIYRLADGRESAAPRNPYVPALRFEFYVPRQFNPDPTGYRASIPDQKFLALHGRLTASFPGLTQRIATPPIGNGLWVDEQGAIVTDECYLYDLILEPTTPAEAGRYREYFIVLLDEFLERPDSAPLGIGQEAALLVLTHVDKLYRER